MKVSIKSLIDLTICCLVFPSLAVITVPKMPIITPKGDEIILRKKYNTNMSLLNEAFEQKRQLFDEPTTESVVTASMKESMRRMSQ